MFEDNVEFEYAPQELNIGDSVVWSGDEAIWFIEAFTFCGSVLIMQEQAPWLKSTEVKRQNVLPETIRPSELKVETDNQCQYEIYNVTLQKSIYTGWGRHDQSLIEIGNLLMKEVILATTPSRNIPCLMWMVRVKDAKIRNEKLVLRRSEITGVTL